MAQASRNIVTEPQQNSGKLHPAKRLALRLKLIL
jgi:hypothetical protein